MKPSPRIVIAMISPIRLHVRCGAASRPLLVDDCLSYKNTVNVLIMKKTIGKCLFGTLSTCRSHEKGDKPCGH